MVVPSGHRPHHSLGGGGLSTGGQGSTAELRNMESGGQSYRLISKKKENVVKWKCCLYFDCCLSLLHNYFPSVMSLEKQETVQF